MCLTIKKSLHSIAQVKSKKNKIKCHPNQISPLNKSRVTPPHIQIIYKVILPSLQPPSSKSFDFIKQISTDTPFSRKDFVISFLPNAPTTCFKTKIYIFTKQIGITKLQSMVKHYNL
jgi:hypothetical protein